MFLPYIVDTTKRFLLNYNKKADFSKINLAQFLEMQSLNSHLLYIESKY